MNIQQFVSQFTTRNLLNEKDMYVSGIHYFLIEEKTKRLMNKNHPAYAGIYLGKEQQGRFIPSVFLLEMLKPHTKKAIINNKSEWLFLCKRDVLKESILKNESEANQYVLVLNQQNEVLGYGINSNNSIKNLFDLGDFLRRER